VADSLDVGHSDCAARCPAEQSFRNQTADIHFAACTMPATKNAMLYALVHAAIIGGAGLVIALLLVSIEPWAGLMSGSGTGKNARFTKPQLDLCKMGQGLNLLPPFRKLGSYGYVTLVSTFAVQSADSADNPQSSTAVLCENNKPLGKPHSLHDEIAEKGGGRYSHWQGTVYFSTVDGSDPNNNGRSYTLVIPQLMCQIGERLQLSPPFLKFGAKGYRSTSPLAPKVADSMDHPSRSKAILCEDDRPFGFPHSLHSEISDKGGGRYSHWLGAVYFSTPDGSDPNSNGRLYTLVLTRAENSATSGPKQ
jgi:hypothetical protein